MIHDIFRSEETASVLKDIGNSRDQKVDESFLSLLEIIFENNPHFFQCVISQLLEKQNTNPELRFFDLGNNPTIDDFKRIIVTLKTDLVNEVQEMDVDDDLYRWTNLSLFAVAIWEVIYKEVTGMQYVDKAV